MVPFVRMEAATAVEVPAPYHRPAGLVLSVVAIPAQPVGPNSNNGPTLGEHPTPRPPEEPSRRPHRWSKLDVDLPSSHDVGPAA